MSRIPVSGERPELATVDGGPPPDGLPRGEFHSRMTDSGLYVDRADPRILISAELIDQAALGILRPEVTLDLSCCADGHVGALLKIRAANVQVVYRLTEWVPRILSYVGEWPE